MQDAKCLQVPLGYMAVHLSRFSLCQFLTTLFISDDAIIEQHTNMLLSSDSVMNLLDFWWTRTSRKSTSGSHARNELQRRHYLVRNEAPVTTSDERRPGLPRPLPTSHSSSPIGARPACFQARIAHSVCAWPPHETSMQIVSVAYRMPRAWRRTGIRADRRSPRSIAQEQKSVAGPEMVVHLVNDPGKTAVGVAVPPDKSFRRFETAIPPLSMSLCVSYTARISERGVWRAQQTFLTAQVGLSFAHWH